MLEQIKQYSFLFSQLVARDFKKKYKKTILGMAWSVLAPLCSLFIMKIVFSRFFGNEIEHYTIFLFCGNLVFSFFVDSTNSGMTSIYENSAIITKVNVPKFIFLLSKNVQTLINFMLTLVIFFLFCAFDGIQFTWKMFMLIIPIFMEVMFNIGAGLFLASLYVYFRDFTYLWGIFITLLNYVSAIFYDISAFPFLVQRFFYLNPLYLFIRYFRKIVIMGSIPSLAFHGVMALYSFSVLGLGIYVYRQNSQKFLYYL